VKCAENAFTAFSIFFSCRLTDYPLSSIDSGQVIILLGLGTFVVPALLYFATLEAGCEVELAEGETVLPECNETVYGLKPSSMITTLASILSLCVAVLIPLMGAIVDYTNHRRRIGRWITFFVCCSALPQLFISEETWFPLTICLLITTTSAMGHTLVLHAYLPDVSS
jgi:MFS-type transporter involved in bile tolerance (Atg22 family)